MENGENASLSVDFRQFHTIYKQLTKKWKASVYKEGAKEPADTILGDELFVWKTKVRESGNYHVKLESFSLIKSQREIITTKSFPLQNNQPLVIIFKREDIKRPFPSFRADAPWRINPSQQFIPLLVEITDLPKEEKIRLKSIYVYDFISVIRPEAPTNILNSEIVQIQDEQGNAVSRNGQPSFLKEEEKQGLSSNSGKNVWFRVAFLNYSKIQTDDKSNIYIGIKFVFENRGSSSSKNYESEMVLRIHVSPESLPKFDDKWFYGDIHYHSEFTNNLTEFGGPMRMAKAAGLASGLSWVAVTDHSCDLTKESFEEMKGQAQNLTVNQKFVLLPSEEITVGKEKKRFKFIDYLHLLSHNCKFIRGNFIGTHSLTQIFQFMKNGEGFSFAAHPTTFKIDWEEDDGDYRAAFPFMQFQGLQIFNARVKKACEISTLSYINPFDKKGEFRSDKKLIELFSNFEKAWEDGLEIWNRLLLQGLKQNPIRKLFIVGGSDAHGDFNFGIVVNPLSGNFMTDNAFGKVRTLVYCEELTPAILMESLKMGKYIVTDGPIAVFKIRGKKTGNNVSGKIGETVEISESEIEFNLEWKTTEEFGGVSEIRIVKNGRVLKPSFHPEEGKSGLLKKLYEQNETLAFYRIEMNSKKDSEKYFCYTNPIWVVKV